VVDMFCFVATVLFDFTCFITVDIGTIVVGTELVVSSSAIMGQWDITGYTTYEGI